MIERQSVEVDVAIVGAGAAGLFCAGRLSGKALKVLVLEKNSAPGKKILISGGGRCNFTNLTISSADYHSQNEAFCKSALSRLGPQVIIDLVNHYQIAWYEKEQGQLFCQKSARDFLQLLLQEAQAAGAQIINDCGELEVRDGPDQEFFILHGPQIEVKARSLICATGGLSFPALGASDWGHRLAKQYGHRVIVPRPALVPMRVEALQGLEGIALPVAISCAGKKIQGALLFTHRGISGPAILNLSLYWEHGQEVIIDWLPGQKIEERIKENRGKHPKQNLTNFLKQFFPQRFVDYGLEKLALSGEMAMGQMPKQETEKLSQWLHHYQFVPDGTEGMRKAEVTKGGVDTQDISSQSMQSKKREHLYFIGEVLDVTGRLGGFNFHWAFASAQAAALDLLKQVAAAD